MQKDLLVILAVVALLAQLAWTKPERDRSSIGKEVILYLPLDGDSRDASHYRHKTLPHGVTPAPDRHGNKSGALRFGEGSHIQIADYKSFNNLKEFTLSAWVNPSQRREHLNIVSKVTPYRDFNVQLDVLGRPLTHIMNGEYEFCYAKNSVETNRWSFVAATYRDHEWRVYLDGKLENTVTVKNAPGWTGQLMTVGNIFPHGPEAFLGSLDEVRVYRRALSEREIGALLKS